MGRQLMAQGERSYPTPNASANWGGADVRSNLVVPFKEALETTPTTEAGWQHCLTCRSQLDP
jgi:hypothetical protein